MVSPREAPKPKNQTRTVSGKRALLVEIERERFQPVYVLFGGDTAFAEEFIATLKKKLLVPGLEPFDYEYVHASDIGGGGVSVIELLQHMRQPPIGAQRRLVVVRALELLDRRSARDLCAGLAAVAHSSRTGDRFSSTVCVVLTCTGDRGWEKLFAETGLDRWVVTLREPRGWELLELLKHWAKGVGLVMDLGAARMLIEIAGEETMVLRNELEKLATVLGPGGRVTGELVKRFVGQSREFELREFVDRALDRDAAGALVILRRLSAWGENPVGIVVWLTNGFLDLLSAKVGLLPPQLRWRVPPPRRAKWQVAEIDRCLHRLYEINRAIVTGHPEPFVLLDLFTVCLGCTAAAARCHADWCLRKERCLM
ncbi:MAG: DNA polymerase III subunit delta [candidate division WOR-3 bacterium]